jgi:hypothetical protein
MVASIPHICDLCHIFRGLVSYFYILNLSCILVIKMNVFLLLYICQKDVQKHKIFFFLWCYVISLSGCDWWVPY